MAHFATLPLGKVVTFRTMGFLSVQPNRESLSGLVAA
jgi:hypothetical protein